MLLCKLQGGAGKARSLCGAWWGRQGPKLAGEGGMVSAIRTWQKLLTMWGLGQMVSGQHGQLLKRFAVLNIAQGALHADHIYR